MCIRDSSGIEDEWQVIAYPGSDDFGVLSNGLSYGVLKTDDQMDLASWLFIRWLSQPMNQARLLQVTGSLPMGTKVLEFMTSFEEKNPHWKAALSLLPEVRSLPAQTNGGIVRMELEDAGTFLFRPEYTAEGIPDLITQMDATIKELSARKP
jgi:ABC-type glycerol-3-phosphate transport system substrate-binding protein